jgi:hypothetical protein
MATRMGSRPSSPATLRHVRKPVQRIALGGVSPKMHGPSVRGIETPVAPHGIAPAAGAFPDFIYNGGPVVTCPFIYTSFWGSLWLSDPGHIEAAGRLTQFQQDLVNSDFMNVLSQYGVGTGNGSGLFMQASFVSNVPNQLTDADIQGIIQSCIDAGTLPEPLANNTTNVLIIYLDENTEENDPSLGIVMCEPTSDNAFGYHYFFTTAAGNPFYYAVIPGLDDTCLTESCPDDAFCSLHLAQTQEQRRTQVTSHEFAEMCTDPELNAWTSPSAGECGDICNGEADSIVGTTSPNVWDVQKQYSKYDDLNTNGASYCLSQNPTAEPKLSPGPSGVSAELTSARRMGMFKAFLPLPSARYDARTNVSSIDEREIELYVRKMFYPIGHQRVFSDLPSVLRQFANVVERRKR